MLNHVRTLLLNRPPGGAGAIGERLVPTDFQSLELPGYLQAARHVLFGHAPDRSMLNYRLAQLTAVMHATELERFVTQFDRRISYLGANTGELFDPATYEPQVRRISGPENSTLQAFILGNPAAPDPSGRMYHQYRVEVLSGGRVRVEKQSPDRQSETHDIDATQNATRGLPLPGSGYRVMLGLPSFVGSGGSIENYYTGLPSGYIYPGNGDLVAGDVWRITVYLRPQWSLGQLVALGDSLDGSTLLSLFGVSPEEPFRTFDSLWRTHDEMPYRLGAFALALAFRAEAVRRREP